MILVVIVIVGLAVEILHLTHEVGIHLTIEQLGGVEAVGVGIHHFGQPRHQVVASVNGDVNLGGHGLVALGLDDEHAIGALGAIECSTILQHLNTLDVVDIDVGQQVVEVAVVQHGALVLHVHDDII